MLNTVQYKAMTKWFVVCSPNLGGFPPAPVVKIQHENILKIVSDLVFSHHC